MVIHRLLRKTQNNTASLHAVLLDILFPIRCIGCNGYGSTLCQECQQRLTVVSLQCCPICQTAITLGGKVCSLCQSTSPALARVIISGDYTQPLLQKVIHRFKYQGDISLAEPLGNLMCRALRSHAANIPDVLIPVPLHPRRLRWRGFNQSQALAACISKQLVPGIEIPVTNDLIARTRYTTPQMKLKDAVSRWENVNNAFNFYAQDQSFSIKNKRVLLVDDVCTTGATLNAIANVLKTAHPKELAAVVIAR